MSVVCLASIFTSPPSPASKSAPDKASEILFSSSSSVYFRICNAVNDRQRLTLLTASGRRTILVEECLDTTLDVVVTVDPVLIRVRPVSVDLVSCCSSAVVSSDWATLPVSFLTAWVSSLKWAIEVVFVNVSTSVPVATSCSLCPTATGSDKPSSFEMYISCTSATTTRSSQSRISVLVVLPRNL